MNWHTANNKAWLNSLLVHLGFVGLMLLGLLWKLFEREPEPHIFELVAGPTAVATQPAPAVTPQPVEQPVVVPEIPRAAPLPALPQVDTRPIPRPEPPPPTPPPPPPQPARQATPPPPPPQQISIDEFRRDRNIPERTQQRPVQQPPSVEVPRIDASPILQDLQSNMVNISPADLQSLTVAQQSELNAYHDQIRSRLRAVFRPNAPNLEAIAEFTVQANGTVVIARIVQSSGDRVFDAAVLQAFRDMQSPGPPPGNRSYDFRITLRSSDGRPR